MGWFVERASALQYKVLDRLRHPAAFEIARARGVTATDLSAFRRARQCLVVTFKRSGDPVPSVVNFGISADGGRIYFRSEPEVAKIRRLKRDPNVRICACSFRGKPRGSLIEAVARVVSEAEVPEAHALIAANWDPASRLFERTVDRLDIPLVYVEIVPREAPSSG